MPLPIPNKIREIKIMDKGLEPEKLAKEYEGSQRYNCCNRADLSPASFVRQHPCNRTKDYHGNGWCSQYESGPVDRNMLQQLQVEGKKK